MAKYTSITEIAKKLGISHSTVSRALNDRPEISAKTKLKVVSLAKELGYQSNASANALNSGESRILGVIVPDLSVHFFAKVVQGIQAIALSNGFGIMLFDSRENKELEIEAVKKCLQFRVDGVLAAISMNTDSYDHFKLLEQYEVPLVFYDRVINFLSVPKVITNDYQAAFNATSYLIESGRKCIAHITASINLNNSNNRLYGYIDALKAANIPIDEQLIHYWEGDSLNIDSFINQLVKDKSTVDAFFVYNDYVANYVANILQKLGTRIPEDIALMGFSDEPVATRMTPQLSTTKQAGERMGQLAVQKLISIILKQEQLVDEKIIINPELIIREST